MNAPAAPRTHASPERLVAGSRWEPVSIAQFLHGTDDPSGFPAVRQGGDETVVFRPSQDALHVERPVGVEVVPWDLIAGIEILHQRTSSGDVAVARIQFPGGPTLDIADADAAPSADLPMSLEAGGPVLLRATRFRLLTASLCACSGLSPRTGSAFHRGGRGHPVPDVVPRPRLTPPWLHPILGALSVAVIVWLFPAIGWWGAVGVILAQVLHEAGHAAAMRVVGMGVRQMLVLPAFGAATVPDRPFASRWDDAWIALAGPLTGLPVAAVALLAFDSPPMDGVRWSLFVAVALGLLNLAPIVPLDGGRVVLALVAGRPRIVRSVVAFAPLVAAVAVLAFVGAEAFSVGTALLIAFCVLWTNLNLRRQAGHDWILRLPVPVAALRVAVRDVTAAVDDVVREDLDGGLPPTPLSGRQAILVVVGYGIVTWALVVAAASLQGIVPEMRLLPGVGGE